MNHHAALQYDSMLREMKNCRGKETDPKTELECCFQTASKYWSKLKEKAVDHHFINSTDEIEFFKKWKPLFVAEIGYYGFCYHARLFLEDIADKEALKKFCSREFMRLDKFIEDNRAFYDYYKADEKYNDEAWFTREKDTDSSTSHDHLAAMLLTLEKYSAYLRQQQPVAL